MDYKKSVIQIFLLLITSIGISIIMPIIVSIFINNINSNTLNDDFFLKLVFIYITILIIKVVVEAINSYLSEKLGWEISNQLRVNLIKHCIDLDFSFHREHKTGEMIERVDGDVTFLSNFFSMFIVNIIGNTIFVALIITIFYIQSGLVGVSYSFIVILAYFVFLSLQDKIVKLWTAYREDEAQLYGYIQESITAREDIIGIGEQKHLSFKLDGLLKKVKKDFRKAIIVSNIPTSGFFALLNVGDFLAIAIGVFLYYKNEMTIGSIYLIINYMGMLNRPFIALRYEMENLQKIGASLNRISELFALKSNICDGDLTLDEDKIFINFRDVSFSYNKIPVLKKLSFDIKAGEVIGIVGKTGSGKTTLIRLISKMYEVDKGGVLINGHDIKEYKHDDYYKNVSIISQQSKVFNGTIYENITDFDSSISREEVNKVLEEVGLNEWVNSMPKGIDTIIDRSMISAGQEQLLNIGRSFLNPAKLYIFDEINSKLDEQAEERVYEAIKKMTLNSTVIFIAHKFKMLDLVDKVLILENGEIKLFEERKNVSDKIIERNLVS